MINAGGLTFLHLKPIFIQAMSHCRKNEISMLTSLDFGVSHYIKVEDKEVTVQTHYLIR